MSLYKFAYQLLGSKKRVYNLSNLYYFLSVIISAFIPYLYGYQIDAIASYDLKLSLQVLGVFTALSFLILGLEYINFHYCVKWVASLRSNSRKNAIKYIFKHSHDYFINSQVGRVSRSVSQLGLVTKVLHYKRRFYLDYIPKIIISMFIAFYTNFLLGLITIFLASIFTLISKNLTKRLSKISRNAELQASKVEGFVFDVIANFRLVRLFNLFPKQFSMLSKHSTKLKHASIKRHVTKRNIHYLANVTDLIIKTFIIIFGSYFYLQGQITIGEVVLFFTLAGVIERTLKDISNHLTEITDLESTVRQAKEYIFTEQDEVKGQDQTLGELDIASPTISLQNLNFSYKQKKVLKNINLEVPYKQKVGIVGPTGSGKSTIFTILNRLYPVGKTQFLINKVDTCELEKNSTRQLFANVSQDTVVFHRTIKENLTLGGEYTDKQIKVALKKAHLWDFVEGLPKKLMTKVGERGVKLSGGQRQRLGIARAILRNSPILLLDEATSALDSKTEKDIQDSIDHLMQDRTVIAIAHRLSTLKNMDRIIVLKHGRIVEDGSPAELLKTKGEYYKMWQHQSKGFIK